MTDLTFIIPVAPYHLDKVEQATAQVAAQTVACAVEVVVDKKSKGPSWARNTGVARAKTPLVAFLDADDLLFPQYAEKMIAAWQPGHYVYCDHFADGRHVVTGPSLLLRSPRRTHHVVTCVISKKMFTWMGGFDEKLAALEDTDFWLRCINNNLCPKYVPIPLMTYSRGGLNSKKAQTESGYPAIWDNMIERYKFTMCGCGGSLPRSPEPINAFFEGAVLVQANWGGNRTWRGRATGINYPMSGNGKLIWVDARDQESQPNKLISANQEDPAAHDIQELAS